MLRRAARFTEDDEDEDDTAGWDGSSERPRPSVCPRDLLTPEGDPVTVHLLTSPGNSLLLQHSLDRLLQWLRPGLRLFHVSERARPLADAPGAGHPSHAVTLFLLESRGEGRVHRALDVLRRPPWRYHHTEGGAPLRRDFYSLGAGLPVWGVRAVHCGGEVLRVTLNSAHHNYEDAVRLYETVLRRRAELQKAGFCWFTLLTGPAFTLQLALKQMPAGVRVVPCRSALLQVRVAEIGQLVPLLPRPCSPISATRWHTHDLDANNILFQTPTPRCSPAAPFSSSSLYSSPRSSPAAQEPSARSETNVDTGVAVAEALDLKESTRLTLDDEFYI